MRRGLKRTLYSGQDGDNTMSDCATNHQKVKQDRKKIRTTAIQQAKPRGRPPKKPLLGDSKRRNSLLDLLASPENGVFVLNNNGNLMTKCSFTHVPYDFIKSLSTDIRLNDDVKNAFLKWEKPDPKRPHNPIVLSRLMGITARKRPKTSISPTYTPQLNVSPNIQCILKSLQLPFPTINLRQCYDKARSLYKTYFCYDLIPSSAHSNFFITEPIRIFMAITPPDLIKSIIDHTNSYSKDIRKHRKTPLNIIQFYKYIGVLLDARRWDVSTVQIFYELHGGSSPMTEKEFRDITSVLQFNHYYLLNKKESRRVKYSHETQLRGLLLDIQKLYTEWMNELITDVHGIVVDETRIPFDHGAPITSNRNPMSNFSLSKPDRVALQLHTVHEPRLKLLLIFAPTMKHFKVKMGQEPFLEPGAHESTAVINYLMSNFNKGNLNHEMIVIADAWYGSLPIAKNIQSYGHHPILKIKHKTNGLPIDMINALKTNYGEYVCMDISNLQTSCLNPLFLIRLGSRYPNTTLSSLFCDDTFGRFNVKIKKTGINIPIDLLPTHSLYKQYSNAADIANQYMAYFRIHTLYKTHLFKTRLYHYFIGLFINQTRLIFNHLWDTQKVKDPNYPKPQSPHQFANVLSKSLYNMIYLEHHYCYSINQNIDIKAMTTQLKSQIFSGFVTPPTISSPPQEDIKCHLSLFGRKCSAATHLCLTCCLNNPSEKPIYLCTKCSEAYHNELTLARKH